MKKVICVDAENLSLTNGKEYEVSEESCKKYLIKNDNGIFDWYNPYLFRLVPEAEYQYGQEVEFLKCGNYYNGKIIAVHENEAWIRDGLCNHIANFKHIRPIQSVRDKVIQLLNELFPCKNAGETADHIIELVKNERG